jgi:hypothetical protein
MNGGIMTEGDLLKIEARVKAATAAPWSTGSIPWQVWFDGGHGKICRIESTAEDRDFIAHARQDVPALIGEVRRLKAELIKAYEPADRSGEIQ